MGHLPDLQLPHFRRFRNHRSRHWFRIQKNVRVEFWKIRKGRCQNRFMDKSKNETFLIPDLPGMIIRVFQFFGLPKDFLQRLPIFCKCWTLTTISTTTQAPHRALRPTISKIVLWRTQRPSWAANFRQAGQMLSQNGSKPGLYSRLRFLLVSQRHMRVVRLISSGHRCFKCTGDAAGYADCADEHIQVLRPLGKFKVFSLLSFFF